MASLFISGLGDGVIKIGWEIFIQNAKESGMVEIIMQNISILPRLTPHTIIFLPKKIVSHWNSEVAGNFRFAVKIWQKITHEIKQ